VGPPDRRTLGAAGEEAVAAWYRAEGYEVLDRNWRRHELGELDLVLGRGPTIVFCEVKTRRGSTFGAPVEAVTWRKQRRLRALAAQWLAERRPGRRDLRFDVASVRPGAGSDLVVEVLESAF
jgi:putative endonuclease